MVDISNGKCRRPLCNPSIIITTTIITVKITQVYGAGVFVGHFKE